MCCCEQNPCLSYPCCNPTSSTTTVPVPTCPDYLDCFNDELIKVGAGDPNALPGLEGAVDKIINDSLFNVPLGGPELSHLRQAVFSILRSIPGYRNNGEITLKVVNGYLQWLAVGDTPLTSTTSSTTTVPI